MISIRSELLEEYVEDIQCVCSGLDQAKYFQTALNLRAKVNLLLSHLSNKGLSTFVQLVCILMFSAYWAHWHGHAMFRYCARWIQEAQLWRYQDRPSLRGSGLTWRSGAAGVTSNSTRSIHASTRMPRRSPSALWRHITDASLVRAVPSLRLQWWQLSRSWSFWNARVRRGWCPKIN